MESISLKEQESTDNQQQKLSCADGLDDGSSLCGLPGEEAQEDHFMEISMSEQMAEDGDAMDAGHIEAKEGNPAGEDALHAPEKEGNKQQVYRQELEQLLAELEKLPDPESKLQRAIDFMEASIAQGGTPHFKSFWEARNICLQIFKENIAPAVRIILWAKYNDLSKEARRLKDILDEQSAFAAEQIEIAVKALEDDIAAFDENLGKMAKIDFQVSSIALAKTLSTYERLQRELNLLNTQASRINGLRKELIRTEMRIRQKNKFFQRLSAAGDKVFPKRKDLIKEVSQLFIADVDTFIQTQFNKENLEDSLFALREEIKILQNMAKVLTLNTHAFTHTRMRLSECWDRVKSEDKERKKERASQKAVFKKNFDDAMKMLQDFKQAYQTQELSTAEATKQLDALVAEIRGLEHGRDEIRLLKSEVQSARKPIQEKIQAAEAERLSQDQEKEKQRRQKIQEVKQQAEELLKTSNALSIEQIESQRDAIMAFINTSSISKADRQEIDKHLKPLRDIISEKQESSLLTLSDDDRQSLQQLKEVLKQRKDRRQEIKSQIDALRKTAGASGLDFEQAMNVNAQIATEKERMEKINQGIQEVEQKIAQLSKR